MDQYLQRSLKNWAAQQQPPVKTRSRLLFAASANAQSSSDSIAREAELIFLQDDGPHPKNLLPVPFDPFWVMHISTPILRAL